MTENKIQLVEYGDYQTPTDFAIRACEILKNELNISPDYIFEPTFGLGSFIEASLSVFNSLKHIFGVEINSKYFNYTKEIIETSYKSTAHSLYNENIFVFDFDTIKERLSKNDKLLIVGNPPWVTNSELSSLGSENLPLKDNFKELKGLDAITGKGNFDIAEYILLQLLSEFSNYENCYIAMLCKTIVARNIVRDIEKYNFHLSEIRLLTFNSMNVFNVNCEAGLLIMKIGRESEKKLYCDVYDFDNPKNKLRTFGWAGDNFISDLDNYKSISSIDGTCKWEWRQGIKHDCSKVMELSLKQENGSYKNGHAQEILIEDDYVFPLLKSSDLKQRIINKSRKNVIVTQTKVKEETDSIEGKSPKLWNYLVENSNYLDNRKSSIYKNSPRFCIFGVGDYSFKPYKVAISGFYKEPVFILAHGEKPIMFDDTCYFIGFDDYKTALITMLIFNSDIVQSFVKSIAFLDSKRPYTKDILMRIDLIKSYNELDFSDLVAIANRHKVPVDFTENDYIDYYKLLNNDN